MRRSFWRVEVRRRRISASAALFALRISESSRMAALITVERFAHSALSPLSVAVAVFIVSSLLRGPR